MDVEPTNETHDIFPVTHKTEGRQVHYLRSQPMPCAIDRMSNGLWLVITAQHPGRAVATRWRSSRFPAMQEPARFVGQVDVVQILSRQQYAWRDDGPNGHPVRQPAACAHFTPEAPSLYEPPPYSAYGFCRGRVREASQRQIFFNKRFSTYKFLPPYALGLRPQRAFA